MNSQITGVIRAILAAAGGWAVGKGYIDNGTATAVGGAIMTLGAAGWSIYSNSQAQKIKSINAADNGVHVVPTEIATSSTVDKPIK